MVARQRITPYWNRMPGFFAYPLGRPALDMLLLTVALGLVPVLVGDGLLGFGAWLAMSLMLFKYGYESLQATAAGDAQPPALADALSGEGYALPIKQVAVLVVLMLFVSAAWRLAGGWLGGPALLVVTLLVPATVILLGMERSFLSAVNPAALLRVATSIGWPYLGLAGLLLCIQLASGTSLALVNILLPGETGLAINTAVAVFLGNYFVLMAFHLLGYVVYQYHDALGYIAEEPQSEGVDSELELFNTLVSEQRHSAAMAEITRLLERHPGDPGLRSRQLRLARLLGDARVLRREGGVAIGEGIRRGRVGEAVDIYLDCRAAEPDFRPASVEHHEPLARELRARGRLREAMELLNGLHRAYPDSRHVVGAYLLAARMFLDDMNRPDQAARVLRFLLERFPDDPHQPEMETLLRSAQARQG